MRHLRKEAAVWTAVAVVIATTALVFQIERPEHLTVLESAKIVEGVVTIDTLVYALFVGVAWKWAAFRSWLVAVPNLSGSWRGEIVPVVKGDGGEAMRADPIASTLLIQQTLWTVSCRVETGEMSSVSYVGDFIHEEPDGESSLVYCYGTDPVLSRREKNPRHDGAVVLAIREKGNLLVGRYWTDRLTRGELSYRRE